MLVHFSVENFRGFRERQNFSMVSHILPRKNSYFERSVDTGFSVAPQLNYQACLFGANGAGKSAFVDAVRFMTSFVANSVQSTRRNGIASEQFIYSEEWRNKPSKFEIAFIIDDTLYHYGFAISRERIEEEWLTARPRSTGRLRQLFDRFYDDNSNQYEWDVNSTYVKGERGYWRSQTRPDALFLTTAVQFDGGILKEAYEWLVGRCKFIDGVEEYNKKLTSGLLVNHEKKSKIISLLSHLGIDLLDISVEETDPIKEPEFLSLPKTVQDVVLENLQETKNFQVEFVRSSNDKKPVSLRLERESRGTQVIFGLVGPFLDVLENGYSVFADNLGADLHPLALRKLVSMFTDQEINQNNAQIIFTTHDVTVTQDRVIEDEDIWLLQRKADLATSLYPLTDFKNYEMGSFDKKYLQGLFGAVPIIF